MNLNDEYIDQLLGKVPKEKVAPDFADQVMQKLEKQATPQSIKQAMLPERYLLLISLLMVMLTLVFMADFSLINTYFSQSVQFILTYFQGRQEVLPSVLDTVRNLPALSLVIFPAIGLLLILQALLQKTGFKQAAKLF
ncbi:MAG: hypothetical protein M0Q90_06935 [Bacteroidales bacterium]|nr:hypothetical protein [Bacteroidales bacterium]